MPATSYTEIRHGVLVAVDGKGLLIEGEAGIGKSSLALELLHRGHQLIADDVVELQIENGQLTGASPTMLAGLLHQRELGTLNIRQLFGVNATRSQTNINAVVTLNLHAPPPVKLENQPQTTTIMSITVPKLTLSVTNPAAVVTRLLVWLSLIEQNQIAANKVLIARQQQQMQQ